MPAAGRLDRRVTIQRATMVTNEIGEKVPVWAEWRTIWMGKKDVRAEERLRSDQEFAAVTAVWISHYIPGLTPQDQLIVDGLTWDILGIAELGRKSGLEITASARAE